MGRSEFFFTKAGKIVAVNIFFQRVRSFFIKLCEIAGMVSFERKVFSQNYVNCGMILAKWNGIFAKFSGKVGF